MTSPAIDHDAAPGTASSPRFLVVGASGFVGRHLIHRLRSAGYSTLGTRSRASKQRSPSATDLVPFSLDVDRIESAIPHRFFSDPGRVHVILCAAVDNMDWCYRERAVSHRIYVDGMCRLIDDLARLEVRPVFISTCYVFDGATGDYDETAPVAPVNEYARQKLAVEQHLRAASRDSLVVRLDKIIGDDPAEETLLTQWHRLASSGAPIRCIADSVLSPTWVDDVVEALVAGCLREISGVFHVANPEQFLRADLARLFCSVMGYPEHVEELPLSDFHFADARALKSSLNGARFAHLAGLRHTPMRVVMERFRSRLA